MAFMKEGAYVEGPGPGAWILDYPKGKDLGKYMALAMPILIVNMGGEMIYILEQRLEAQSVPKEKGLRGACARHRDRPPRAAYVRCNAAA
ncbi:hypothetical protein T492DRAFT_874877 [Pavlovales sp. CCMP2436]|nr:hypothetical protein T492DRAFT_874877 [Pavlovales sp. CCMP2436]